MRSGSTLGSGSLHKPTHRHGYNPPLSTDSDMTHAPLVDGHDLADSVMESKPHLFSQ
jgi:hypothetical protein